MKKTSELSRRIVLRGLGGLGITLPFLEFQRDAMAQTASPGPKRFIVFFEHGGTISTTFRDGSRADGNGEYQGVNAWNPASPAEALELGAIHQPLAAHKDQLLVLGAIDNMTVRKNGPYGGDHGWSNAMALTCARCTKTVTDPNNSGGDIYVPASRSIDFELAERLNARNAVPFPIVSLQVPAHNYGTPFYRASNQPVDGEYNPTAAFNSLFANVATGGAPNTAALRAQARQKSILDGTKKSLGTFKSRLTSSDKVLIDTHLEHIRAIEQQLSATVPPPSAACAKPDISTSGTTATTGYYNVNIAKTAPVMVDIMIAAFRCGLTNVATLNIGDFHATWLNPTFPAAYDIGHSLHHSANSTGKTGADGAKWQQWYDTMLINRRWRMSLLARFMDGLKATPEGASGTMLDNSIILETSEFSLGADHSSTDLPILLAGKAGGRLRTGRFVNYNTKQVAGATTFTSAYATKASTHNLFTSILNLFDYPDTNFGSVGDAYVTGPLSGLT